MIDENMVERVVKAFREKLSSGALDAFDFTYAHEVAEVAIEAMNLDTIPIVDMKDLG